MKKIAALPLMTPLFRNLSLWVLAYLLTFSGSAYADAYQVGLNLYSRGNYAEAASFFLTSVGEDAENANAHYYLADSYLKLNRLAEAQAEYQKILTLAPNSQAAKLSRVGLSRLRHYTDGLNDPGWQRSGGSGGATDRYLGSTLPGDDYLEDITDSGRWVRWSLSKMPLKIYIEQAPSGIRNFQPAFTGQVPRALDVWCDVLGRQLSYTLVSVKEQADIRVSWVNSIDSQGRNEEGKTSYTAGLTIPHYQGERIDHMEVKLSTFNILGQPQTADLIYAVAIHELGHSLGLLGHSDQPGDIMYAENKNVIVPSRRDMNTFRKLYSRDADINNLPPESRKSAPRSAEELARAVDRSLARLELEAQQTGLALNYLNLSVAYFQKAQQGIQGGENAKPWLDKAMSAINQALQIEPKDPRAFHRRSLIHQEYGNFDAAFQDIQKAIAYDRTEPDYLMLKAWYLTRLNRTGEARGTLDAYLLAKPSAAGSPDVRRIQQALAQ